MTKEEIKQLADGYYAGEKWESEQLESVAKWGFRTGYALALRHKEKEAYKTLCEQQVDKDRQRKDFEQARANYWMSKNNMN